MRIRRHLGAGTVASALAVPLALVSIACGTPGGGKVGGTQQEGVAATVAQATTAVAPKPTGPFIAFADGQYEVGVGAGQVKPGTYKTTVPADSYGCYWERQKALGGELTDIIANDTLQAGEPGLVTIKATDRGFKSQRCGEWKLAG